MNSGESLKEYKPAAMRRDLRLPVRFHAVGSGADSQVGYTVNVSASGMFVGTRSPLPVSTVIEITVVRNEEVQVIRGEVIRIVTPMLRAESEEPEGMGIRFLNPEAPAVEKLVGYWHQFVSRQFQPRARR